MSDTLTRCPFNAQHVMPRTSLQRHIIRCMVNYPNFVVCPYNAMHRFQNNEILAEHMVVCTFKEKHLSLNEEGPRSKNQPLYHIENTTEFNLKEENWDD